MTLEYKPGLVICMRAKGGVGVGVTVEVAVLVGVLVGYGHFGRIVALGSTEAVGVRVCVGGILVAVGGRGVTLGLTTGVSVLPTAAATVAAKVSVGSNTSNVAVSVEICVSTTTCSSGLSPDIPGKFVWQATNINRPTRQTRPMPRNLAIRSKYFSLALTMPPAMGAAGGQYPPADIFLKFVNFTVF